MKNHEANKKHNFVRNLVKQKPLNLIKREKIEKELRKRLSNYDFQVLGKFIRFINYLSFENLIEVNEASLRCMKEELFKERKNGLFTTSPLFGRDEINFEQKEEDFFESIKEILDGNIQVIKDVPKILGNKGFDDYLKKILPDENSNISSLCPDIKLIIRTSSNFELMEK